MPAKRPAGQPAGREFFARPFLEVAHDLIGMSLVWDGCGGRIVEVEGYGAENDAACHVATRPSTLAFFRSRPPGTAYVYLNYGIHWMLNILAGDGIILVRALEPKLGIPAMQERRRRTSLRDLCSGPGKLGCALGIHGGVHGTDLTGGVFSRVAGTPPEVVRDLRIGISASRDLPWRFLERGSPWVSVAFPAPPSRTGATPRHRRRR